MKKIIVRNKKPEVLLVCSQNNFPLEKTYVPTSFTNKLLSLVIIGNDRMPDYHYSRPWYRSGGGMDGSGL